MNKQPTEINCRIRLKATPDEVFSLLTTDDGRALFWAERTVQTGDRIVFYFPNGGSLWVSGVTLHDNGTGSSQGGGLGWEGDGGNKVQGMIERISGSGNEEALLFINHDILEDQFRGDRCSKTPFPLHSGS